MVLIRTLRPLVRLRIPRPAPDVAHERRQPAITRRTIREFPPPTPLDTPCRLWQGPLDRDGYGSLWRTDSDGERHKTRVHRWVASVAAERPLRPDQIVMHLCDNRLCYRLDHLRVATVRENNADMVAKGRLVHVSTPLPGAANPSAKLTEVEVRAIRVRWRQGASTRTLSEEYGVSRNTISNIVKGLSWRPTTVDLLCPTGTPDAVERTSRVKRAAP